MRFGVRECTNIVFRAKTNTTIGKSEFKAGQPVLYIDSAKTSTLEGAATTVYAQGGRGNARLISWEGEKTLTFTVEDALLSPLGFSILSGAGLIETGKNSNVPQVHAHRVAQGLIETATRQMSEAVTTHAYYVKVLDGSVYKYAQVKDQNGEPISIDANLKQFLTAAKESSYVVPEGDLAAQAIHTYFIDHEDTTVADMVSTFLEKTEITALENPGESSPQFVDLKITITEESYLFVDLTAGLYEGESICDTAPIFVIATEQDGSLTSTICTVKEFISTDGRKTGVIIETKDPNKDPNTPEATITNLSAGSAVTVDFYVIAGSEVQELQIDAENFAGYYYVEADTLFRRQDTGKDMPAIITLPNVKIQSNFTFTMASSGDPSTFTFTMDAMPGYTYFNKTKKVLCVLQIINTKADDIGWNSVMKHTNGSEAKHDDGWFKDSWVTESTGS